MKASAILEAALYADDLEAAEAFYRDALGLEVIGRATGRHVFFRCGEAVVLVFNAQATQAPSLAKGIAVPPHGARGPGHLCFRADAAEIDEWAERLAACGVAIERQVAWPQGGRSLYFRDPAGNSLELGEARMWGFA